MSDPQWCLRQAERIGVCCKALVDHLFADRVLDNLRGVKSLIGLRNKYGAARLEAACARALSFAAPRYRTVKTILENGLDQVADVAAFDALSDTYARGGRFCRDPKSLFRN
jgi:hypothetical protein